MPDDNAVSLSSQETDNTAWLCFPVGDNTVSKLSSQETDYYFAAHFVTESTVSTISSHQTPPLAELVGDRQYCFAVSRRKRQYSPLLLARDTTTDYFIRGSGNNAHFASFRPRESRIPRYTR